MESRRPADQSLIQNGLWERARFTVPDDVPEERVQFRSDKYMHRFGDHLEGVGYTVLSMMRPRRYTGPLPEPEGRHLYHVYAWVRRRPIVAHMEVPDHAVADMQRLGLVLTE